MTTINKILTAEMFKKHKKNRGTLCYSRFLSGVNNVRIVVDSGIDPHPGIITKKPSVSAVVVNSSGQWRTIVAGSQFTVTSLVKGIRDIESQVSSVPSCHCGALKFKAKSGKIVCSNACWVKGNPRRPQKAWKSAALPPTTKVLPKDEVIWTLQFQLGDLVTPANYGEDMTEGPLTDNRKTDVGIVKSVDGGVATIYWMKGSDRPDQIGNSRTGMTMTSRVGFHYYSVAPRLGHRPNRLPLCVISRDVKWQRQKE